MNSLLFVAIAAAAVALAVLLGRRRRRRSMENGGASTPPGDLERGFEWPTEEPVAPTETGGGAEPEPIRFTVYHPQELVPERWTKLAAYVHLAEALAAVERDRDSVLAGEPPVHRQRSADAVLPIARESLLRVVPELPGCRFNPPDASVLWVEDWHRVTFDLEARRGIPGFEPGRAVNGRVAFYVESVLVGEVPIWALISERAQPLPLALEPSPPAAPFGRVFVSYSHRDGEVVESVGRAYKALGMSFLRDVEALRSGEEWNPRLLELIEGADVFQLYWSRAAASSPFVEQEWRHALAQQRPAPFIRPLYWRQPMEPPPSELATRHFAFLPGLESG